MTHPDATVRHVLGLGARGLSASEIAGVVRVPRRTIADWLGGRTPRAARPGLCATCQGPLHRFDELPDDYVHLLGLYLGDGCLSTHPRGVYKLRIALDARYPDIIDEAAASIAGVLPRNSVGRVRERSGYVEVYAFSKTLRCLFPQHGPGRKHERPIVLEEWQWRLVDRSPELLLRALIQSDGCRFINTGRNWRSPRYAFHNRSADIRRIFCDACDMLGLRYTLAPHTVYVSRKADVARMDEFIGPKS